MNFKRKGPKETRAGCLMCKPWKFMGNRKEGKRIQVVKMEESTKSQIASLITEL